MTAKEYLQQVRKLNLQIRNKKLELENLTYQMTGSRALSFTDKPPTVSKSTKSPQEKFIHRYLKYEQDIKSDIAKLLDLKKEVMQMIDRIGDSSCVDLLYRRYIHCQSWKQISAEMNYNHQYIFQLHSKALRLFDEVLTKSYFLM